MSDPVFSNPEVFPEAGGVDPVGLVENGAVASGERASSFALVVELALGCEPDKDVESVGVVPGAVEVGTLLAAAGLEAGGVGFVGVSAGAGAAIRTGWLTLPLYCVQP